MRAVRLGGGYGAMLYYASLCSSLQCDIIYHLDAFMCEEKLGFLLVCVRVSVSLLSVDPTECSVGVPARAR